MPSEIGTIENDFPIPDSIADSTMASIMTNNGYHCAYAGKWHAHTISLPSEFSFGFHMIHENGDIGLAEACVEFLKNKPEKPFFLVASFTNPHNICEYARNQNTPHASFEEPALEDCPNLPENFAVNPYDASVLAFEKIQDYALYPTQHYTPDNWRRYRNAYYRLVEAVDVEIGKIVNEIDSQNLWKNTVVIFTSDHGDGVGAHQWNQKTALYEEIVNVPFIVCAPDNKENGKVLPQLVNGAVDLMPSIFDWADIKMLPNRKGVSFKNLVEKGKPDTRHQKYVVTETNFNQTRGSLGWMLRTDKYKYVLYDKGNYREQLFDMDTDRKEMRNLAVESQYQDILKEHRELLKEWMKNHPAPNRERHLSYIPK